MREWFVTKQQLAFADEMRDEARTREVTISTFPFLKTDLKLYVFTEEELRLLWNTADQIGWRKGRDYEANPNNILKYTSFDDYINGTLELQQKFGGGEK